MNVGCLCIQPEISKSFIRYDVLQQQKYAPRYKFFTVFSFAKPLVVRMDGRKRISVITWSG